MEGGKKSNANQYVCTNAPPRSGKKKGKKAVSIFAANDSMEGFDFRQVVGIGAGRGGRIRSGRTD